MDKKVYRSIDDKVLAGVCGGLAKYFDIDSTIIRVLWILGFFAGGLGILAYIICAVIIPQESFVEYNMNKSTYNEAMPRYDEDRSKKNKVVLGSILVIIGVFSLIDEYLYWMDIEKLWPIIFIVIGIYIIVKKQGDD
ncbi:PspC domain-containing protein [Tepidibacter hydrothermalis]|uniref:PspC domain-containing protein n=1 Tax=Tepidibacter hydrothermalis TaxID=3036126 RepID=A0ABY8EHE2_9FIRM|nr:PspC domain-containing protein [Tepidibacter hydrothermalis]WFD11275.1 PspC domain-containing protein [Tepidibacter hydrothermalis]